MCKYFFSSATIIILLLFNSELLSQGLDLYYQFGLQGEYFNQDSYSGMNLNFVIKPKDEIILNNIFLDDLMVLGVNTNQYDRKIRANFTLLNFKGCNIDTNAGFFGSGEGNILSIKHNIQIKSDISWLKICPGFGYGQLIGSNRAVFLGVNGGLGISSEYLWANVNGFGNKDFDGVSILGSALFFYQMDYLRIKIANDFKSIVWSDQILYSNTPSLELTFNITKYFNRNYQKGHLLILSAGITNSSLYYESDRSQALTYFLNIFIHE